MMEKIILFVCLFYVCSATYYVPCNYGRCPKYWTCRNNQCICLKPYLLKGGKCVAPDPCKNVDCGRCGKCDDGKCVCYKGCVLENGKCVVPDPCKNVDCGTCGKCYRGKCVCDKGCILKDGKCVDPCKNVNCGPYGKCVGGKCVCDEGYQLNKDGKCVDPCKSVNCGPNGKCVAGKCVCRKGYEVREGKCVEKCPPRKFFDKCPTACPINCDNVRNPPKTCTKNCRPNTNCVCKRPFIEKSSTDFSCVLPGQCPDPCDKVECGENQVCKKGEGVCVCKKGFIPSKGKCIRPDPCATVRCKDPRVCVAGKCVCPKGYKDLFGFKCIKITVCKNGMVPARCPAPCPLTCQNYRNPSYCINRCKGVTCVCRKGYVQRSSKDTRCILPKYCPVIYG